MALRWTIPFVSQNGVSCHADIYDSAYSGSTVTTLVGAVSPVEIEEEKGDDLLTIIRYSTGYLNIVERTRGELDDLYPETNTDHKVKIYYGAKCIFLGFMQAQSFDNQWVPSPRVMKFPIISPLGLLSDIKMNTYNPPSRETVVSFMADAIDILNDVGAEYNSVTIPQFGETASAAAEDFYKRRVYSLVFCPFNQNYDQTSASTNSLFEPCMLDTVFNAFCNLFNCIVHETPTGLMFVKFDWTGNYNIYALSQFRSMGTPASGYNGGSSVDLSTNFTPSDDQGNESSIMPYEQVTQQYDGEYIREVAFDFKHLKYYGEAAHYNARIAYFRSDTPELSGIETSTAFNNDGSLAHVGAIACSYGTEVNQTEGFLINLPYSTIRTDPLFTVKFYNQPTGRSFIVAYEKKWGERAWLMGQDTQQVHKTVKFSLRINGMYYHGAGVWNSTQAVYEGDRWDVTNAPYGDYIEMIFYQGISTGAESEAVPLIAINSITITEPKSAYSDYKVVQTDETTHNLGNGKGQGEANVPMIISIYRLNSNTAGTSIRNPFTLSDNYYYVLKSRNRLEIRFKGNASNITAEMYGKYVAFENYNWRMISVSYYPWDDEIVITLQKMA